MKYYLMLVACYDENTEKIYDKGATYAESDFSEYKLRVYTEANLFVEVAAPASASKPEKQAIESDAVKAAKAKIKADKKDDRSGKDAGDADDQDPDEGEDTDDSEDELDLDALNKKELKALCKDLELTHYGRKNKDELIEAILEASAQDEGSEK